MGKAAHLKEERLEIRINRELKELIQRAATASGITVSAFSKEKLLEASKKVLFEDHALITLTNKERGAFLKALNSPPKPNRALKSLLRKSD